MTELLKKSTPKTQRDLDVRPKKRHTSTWYSEWQIFGRLGFSLVRSIGTNRAPHGVGKTGRLAVHAMPPKRWRWNNSSGYICLAHASLPQRNCYFAQYREANIKPRSTWSPSPHLREILSLQRLLESIRISVLGDEGGDLPNNLFLHFLQRHGWRNPERERQTAA